MLLSRVMLARGPIYYLELGKGPNLLFLHGAIATCEAYLSLLKLLANNFHVLAPVLPGHGLSFATTGDWQLENFAGSLINFFSETEFNPDLLIGHSFGGTLCLLLTASKIGKRTVVMDPPGLPFDFELKDYLQAMIKEGQALFIKRPDLIRLAQTARATGTLIQTLIHHPNNISYFPQQGPVFDISGSLRKIKNPVEIFWGEDDQVVPLKVGKKLQKMINQSCLRVLAARGHNYPITDPEFTFREISKVLK